MELMTNTNMITGKIVDMIQYADQELTIISPYVQLDNWAELNQALNFLIKEQPHVKITFFIREKKESDKYYQALEALKPFVDKIKIFIVPDLHTKLYFDGKRALLSSMNLFKHSAEKNHEIGTYFDDDQSIEKIRKYISVLRASENIDEYHPPTFQEKPVPKEEKDTNWIHETFTVVSIGTKWVKIINAEGYENKFLIAAAPGLKEGDQYEADVKRIWHKTPYGHQVEYQELKEVKKKTGHCIICETEIELDPAYPLCKQCYFKNKQYKGNIFGKVCHRCGQPQKGITDSHPECRTCYKNV